MSQTLIHPRRLLTLLRKVVCDVTMKNSQFVPLYIELYHYYETHSVSFTKTYKYLIIQISILFINNKKLPMDLYKLHTVHVPLWTRIHMMKKKVSIPDFILNRAI